MSVAQLDPVDRPERPRAGVYLRISRDPMDKRTGVARQLADCREIADDLGWDAGPRSAVRYGLAHPCKARALMPRRCPLNRAYENH